MRDGALAEVGVEVGRRRGRHDLHSLGQQASADRTGGTTTHDQWPPAPSSNYRVADMTAVTAVAETMRRRPGMPAGERLRSIAASVLWSRALGRAGPSGWVCQSPTYPSRPPVFVSISLTACGYPCEPRTKKSSVPRESRDGASACVMYTILRFAFTYPIS